jgi:hypothetical protein
LSPEEKPPQLGDADELLFRQVHPAWVRDGRPSSQAFRPTAKDNGQLSVARGALTTAQAAYEHHTTRLGFQSAGTWAVSVGECRGLSLPTVADPIPEAPGQPADRAHAVIQFLGLSKAQIEAKGAKLARFASERGRLYPAPAPQ